METSAGSSPRNPDVWEPLPPEAFDSAAARHLLRRVTWSATPAEVNRAVRDGLPATLGRLFPGETVPFPKPPAIAKLEKEAPELTQRIRAASAQEKRELQREAREASQQALREMSIQWLQFASQPAVAAQEKWTLFLSDIYVVAYEKVRNAAHIFDHTAILREHGFGTAPALTKAVSRSSAMIRYLDLQDSRRDAPNENFARELFELFVLGEGNYSERDIKEAARAFTGYRHREGAFVFARRQHDNTPKTIFGRTASFSGDEVIDLAYEQPAAATWLPHELARFYLSDSPIPQEQLAALGDWWRARNFDLRALAQRFFGSRLFFEPYHRGNYIKSPIQFYLGLIQDLELEVAPFARQVLGSLRQMGQNPFNPPNVRGWVGGRQWINSATLAARRQLVHVLLQPINEAALNGDEQRDLAAAREAGRARFTVDPSYFEALSRLSADELAARLIDSFLSGETSPTSRDDIIRFLKNNSSTPAARRIRSVLAALLQSPQYQLC